MNVNFQGEDLELRRLGLSDIFEVQRICVDILQGAEIRNLKFSSSGQDPNEAVMALAMFLLSGVDFAEERITSWVKSLFKEPYEKDIFLPGILEFVDLLIDHPDIEAFLEQARKLAPKLVKLALRVGPTRQKEETQD